MRFFLVAFLLSLWPHYGQAQLPLYTPLQLPDGSRATLNFAIEQLFAATNRFKPDIDEGSDFQAGRFFDEYHRALNQSNPELRGELAASIYPRLIKNFYAYAMEQASENFLARFDFLIHQASKNSSPLPPDLGSLRDQLLLRGIVFELRRVKISAFNIHYWLRQLSDPDLGFSLLLSVLDFYQFQLSFEQDTAEMGYRFQGLLGLLLRDFPWNRSRESQFLQMLASIHDPSVLQWYSQARISLNRSLYQGRSIFCFYTHTQLNKHINQPDLFPQELLLARIAQFLTFGASWDAECESSSLRSELIIWSTHYPKYHDLVQKLLHLSAIPTSVHESLR